MPTARRRFQVTETEEVARVIDAAALQWPGESRSQLLARVIRTGGDSVNERSPSLRRSRVVAVRRSSGRYEEGFGGDYLRRLRDDWPA